MGGLHYSALCSLDGFVEDSNGAFDWAVPDDETMAYVNDLERPVGTYLYGRRMYEVMLYWETEGAAPTDSAAEQDFAQIWRSARKIVFSRTLTAPLTANTTIEPRFDRNLVTRLKREFASDISIGGTEIAAAALDAGVLDEVNLFFVPVLVGGGKPVLPTRTRAQLTLLDERRVGAGFVHLRYAVNQS